MSSLLLSLPAELLELVVFESSTPTRKALRSTCLRLESIATPLVFESLLIDTRNRRHVSKFLRNLCSGKGLAKYVQHIHLVSLKLPRKLLGLRKEREWGKPSRRCYTVYDIIEGHFVSQSTAFLDLANSASSCSASDKRIFTNTALWRSLSHITSLSISSLGWQTEKVRPQSSSYWSHRSQFPPVMDVSNTRAPSSARAPASLHSPYITHSIPMTDSIHSPLPSSFCSAVPNRCASPLYLSPAISPSVLRKCPRSFRTSVTFSHSPSTWTLSRVNSGSR
ncbi:uncharacterized protein EV420DRAFT_314280 [Desarmillaria tabescens]|uniref:F-box domain-containing protein n=1 Tax=Armillaria tabescens TaxID=1929756 RepID=A0AA39KDR8_ARMTA|nr:uncharacterized protein EV420DRAFT_314280 [Desarmillaria tabescens]KAK0459299.1 hypothetical protein EV420DRAFT_314280 [Desarmillaria tabescens]